MFLNTKDGAFSRLVPLVAESLMDHTKHDRIWINNLPSTMNMFTEEEQKFNTCMQKAESQLKALFDKSVSELFVSQQDAFQIYNSFGVPVEIIRDMANQRGLNFCDEDFERERSIHAQKSKSKKNKDG